MSIELIHGDCLEVMPELNRKADLVLADPPYGTTACKWDSVIPFQLMWVRIWPLVNDNSAVCLFGSEPFSSACRMSQINRFRYDWIYHKRCASNFAQAKYAPMKEHENIMVFSIKKHRYSPIKETRKGSGLDRVKYKFGEKSNNPATEFAGTIIGKANESQDELRYPSSVQKFNNRASGDRGFHPTQKPVALLEYLIKTYTNEGDTVLDFCMGSGSTGVACQNTGRNFIGIEKEKKYYDIACERMALKG